MRTIAEDERLSEIEHDHRLRGCALEIAAQLPHDEQEALLILEYAKQLVVDFLRGRANSTAEVSRLKPVA